MAAVHDGKLGRRITPEEFQTWVHGRNTGDTLEYFFGRPLPNRKQTRKRKPRKRFTAPSAARARITNWRTDWWNFWISLRRIRFPARLPQHPAGTMSVSFFDTLGLDHWFDLDKVIYNDGTLPGKPAPDLYLKAAQRLLRCTGNLCNL